jgi:hypothetical protein
MAEYDRLHFLSLPAEMRVRIYEYVFGSTTVAFVMAEGQLGTYMSVRPWQRKISSSPLPLLLTCHLVSTEAIKALYDVMTFQIRVKEFKCETWSHRLSPDFLKHVRKLEMHFQVEGKGEWGRFQELLHDTREVITHLNKGCRSFLVLKVKIQFSRERPGSLDSLVRWLTYLGWQPQGSYCFSGPENGSAISKQVHAKFLQATGMKEDKSMSFKNPALAVYAAGRIGV